MQVRAIKTIIENDVDENPQASPCQPGWKHCVPGDTGTIVHVSSDGYATVLFDRTQTATLAMPDEIEGITAQV